MANAFVISIDPVQLARVQRELQLIPGAVSKATYQAVFRTTRTLNKEVRDVIRAKLNLQQKYADRRIFQKVETRGGAWEGSVKISGKSIPMIGYNPLVSRTSGATVQPDRTKAPVRLTAAFKAVGRGPLPTGVVSGGHTGLWLRSRKSKNGRLTKLGFATRLRIREVSGPPITDLIGKQEILAKLTTDSQAQLKRELQSQIYRFTHRRVLL